MVGAVYFFLYYFTFSLMIRKMNLKTPGREEDDEETKLFTRADFKAKTGVGPDSSSAPNVSDSVSVLILRGLGGKQNIADVDCCATRLRVTVIDGGKVSDTLLKQSGASGVIRKGNGIQVIYGPQVAVIKSNLVDFMETDSADFVEAEEVLQPESPKAAKSMQSIRLSAHMNGTLVPLAEVADEAFSSGALGGGVAIEPYEGKLFAPADGTVEAVFETGHALSMTTAEGAEILLHIGMDTIKLGGKFFYPHVENGQNVKQGDLLISFDLNEISAAGCPVTTPMVVCNSDEYTEISVLTDGTVKVGEDILHVQS